MATGYARWAGAATPAKGQVEIDGNMIGRIADRTTSSSPERDAKIMGRWVVLRCPLRLQGVVGR